MKISHRFSSIKSIKVHVDGTPASAEAVFLPIYYIAASFSKKDVYIIGRAQFKNLKFIILHRPMQGHNIYTYL